MPDAIARPTLRTRLRDTVAAVARAWGFGPGHQVGGAHVFTAVGVDPYTGGGWHTLHDLDGTGFQRGLRLERFHGLPILASIQLLYASALAQLRPYVHDVDLATGVITENTHVAAARLLVQPNDYESTATLLSRLAYDWLAGEALVVVTRNDRHEPASMHLIPRGNWSARVDPESRGIFYLVTDDDNLLMDPNPAAVTVADIATGRVSILRAKDCMHLRWKTPRHPMIGESAFAEAGIAAGINVALNRAQIAFTENMRRVSVALTTEAALTAQQMTQLRAAFDAQASKWAQGGIPILSNGLKMTSADLTAVDETVITALRFTNEEIARCAGVPPPLYGDLTSGSITSSEVLVRHWLSVSLGGLIERLERELERLFGMDGRHQYIDLSTEALLRSDLASQASAMAQFVQGGILTPTEARATIGRGPAPGGDQLLVQRQMTPIILNTELAAAELAQKAAAAAAPEQEPPPSPPEPPAEDAEEARARAVAVARTAFAGRVRQRLEGIA